MGLIVYYAMLVQFVLLVRINTLKKMVIVNFVIIQNVPLVLINLQIVQLIVIVAAKHVILQEIVTHVKKDSF